MSEVVSLIQDVFAQSISKLNISTWEWALATVVSDQQVLNSKQMVLDFMIGWVLLDIGQGVHITSGCA